MRCIQRTDASDDDDADNNNDDDDDDDNVLMIVSGARRRGWRVPLLDDEIDVGSKEESML